MKVRNLFLALLVLVSGWVSAPAQDLAPIPPDSLQSNDEVASPAEAGIDLNDLAPPALDELAPEPPPSIGAPPVAEPTVEVSDEPQRSPITTAPTPMPVGPKSTAIPLQQMIRNQVDRMANRTARTPSDFQGNVRTIQPQLQPKPIQHRPVQQYQSRPQYQQQNQYQQQQQRAAATNSRSRGNETIIYNSPNVSVAVPVIAIETTGPSDININKTATFVITMKNVGETAAHNIQLRTTIPSTVEFATSSVASKREDNALVFDVGSLAPKKTTQVRVNVVPRKTGPVEMISTATISSQLRSAFHVRQPALEVSAESAPEALYGINVPLKITVTNIGDGVAENVTVVPQLPESMTQQGQPQALQVGTLRAGQSKQLTYSVPAAQAGRLTIGFKALDSNGTDASADTSIVIRRPMLKTEFVGPSVTFVDRENTYELHVSNPGDADIKGVEVFWALSEGLRLTVLGNEMQFDRKRNLLATQIALLPAGATETLRFKAKAVGGGQQLQEALARVKGGISSTQQHVTRVLTRANINVAIANRQGATEVDERATIDVVLQNAGSALAENIEVRVLLPKDLEASIAEAYEVQGNEIRFPLITLEPKQRMVLSFQATSTAAGDHRFRVLVQPSDGSSAIAFEGGTFFFNTQQLNEGVANQPDTGLNTIPR